MAILIRHAGTAGTRYSKQQLLAVRGCFQQYKALYKNETSKWCNRTYAMG